MLLLFSLLQIAAAAPTAAAPAAAVVTALPACVVGRGPVGGGGRGADLARFRRCANAAAAFAFAFEVVSLSFEDDDVGVGERDRARRRVVVVPPPPGAAIIGGGPPVVGGPPEEEGGPFLDDGNSSLRPTAGVGGTEVVGGILGFVVVVAVFIIGSTMPDLEASAANTSIFCFVVSDGLFGCTLGYISELCLVARGMCAA